MRFSVIIPTFNRAGYVGRAVESVLSQTYQNFELIVVDDGSEDDTAGLLSPFADRIRYVRQPRGERSAARNRGIELSSGDVLAFLDSDDLWRPRKLERQVKALRKDPDIGFLYSSFNRIDGRGRAIPWPPGRTPRGKSGWIYPGILGADYAIQISTVAVRRSALPEGVPFRTDLSAAEDLEFLARVARRFKAHYDPEPLSSYRIHPGQSIQQISAADLEDAEREAFGTLLSDSGLPGPTRRLCRSRRLMRLAAWYARERNGAIARSKLLAGFRAWPPIMFDWRWWGIWMLALRPDILRNPSLSGFFVAGPGGHVMPEETELTGS